MCEDLRLGLDPFSDGLADSDLDGSSCANHRRVWGQANEEL